MKIKKTLEMTKEQREILKQAVDILTDMEMDMDTADLELVQNCYEEELDYLPHDKPLPTAIDYIGTLLGMAEIVEDMGEEENED